MNANFWQLFVSFYVVWITRSFQYTYTPFPVHAVSSDELPTVSSASRFQFST